MEYVRLGACIYIESENTFASMPYALLQIILCYLKFLEVSGGMVMKRQI